VTVYDPSVIGEARGWRRGPGSDRGSTYFVNMSPVLALIVQTFVQHPDDVLKSFSMVWPVSEMKDQPCGRRGVLVVGHLGQLMHLRSTWKNILVACDCTDFCLGIRVSVGDVLHSP
jgi:hypothetical protein